MDIYSKRRRARRLNDPNKTVEKDTEDDGPDPDDLELDYGGVVEKMNDEAEKEDLREELAKSLGGDGSGLDFTEVFKDADGDPDLELDYSEVAKREYESPEDRRTRKVAAAVADELEQRGVTPGPGDDADEDGEDTADGGPVEKAGERTADLLDSMQDDLRGLKRKRAVRTLVKKYVADGGDPKDTMDEVFEWYDRNSAATVKYEDGSVELVEEEAA